MASLTPCGPPWSLRQTQGLHLVAPARDQRPCSTCTAFAAIAAAETAVASVLGVNGSLVQLSEQYLYYCTPGGQTRSCTSGATLAKVMEDLSSRILLERACLPYTPDLSMSQTTQELCGVPLRRCDRGDPQAMLGYFQVVSVTAAWQVMGILDGR
jgi:hypothetical protein